MLITIISLCQIQRIHERIIKHIPSIIRIIIIAPQNRNFNLIIYNYILFHRTTIIIKIWHLKIIVRLLRDSRTRKMIQWFQKNWTRSYIRWKSHIRLSRVTIKVTYLSTFPLSPSKNQTQPYVKLSKYD